MMTILNLVNVLILELFLTMIVVMTVRHLMTRTGRQTILNVRKERTDYDSVTNRKAG